MSSDDVNDRKRKLSNIIKKITETQLLKIREADNNACNRQDCKFSMTPKERDNEMNNAMSIKLLNEKELSHFNTEVAGSSGGRPAALPKHVGSNVTM